jgi:hypothetical protein
MDKVKMNTVDIIRNVSLSSGFSQRAVKKVFRNCIDEMKQMLLTGHKVSLTGFLFLTLDEQTVKSSTGIPELIGTHPRAKARLYSQYKKTIRENGRELHNAILERKKAIQNDPVIKSKTEELKKINSSIKNNENKCAKMAGAFLQ